MNWDIQLFKLNFDGREVDAVAKVVSGGWLSMGEKILDFESSFEGLLAEKSYCSAVTNCTAALHLALLALDVTKGDEVIIPALTFVADANVVNIVGATPVLADCTSTDDWNMSVGSIEAKITERTKVVIVVHYAGYPCKDIGKITELCKERGLGLIEDVAHAPGATFDGKACGTWGDIGCFSCYPTKNLGAIGDAGIVVTNSSSLISKLKVLREYGWKERYISDVNGINSRLDEIQAAILRVKLKYLDSDNNKRIEIANIYRTIICKRDSLILPVKNINMTHVYHQFVIINDRRDEILSSLKKINIICGIHYPKPVHQQKAYTSLGYQSVSLVNTNYISDKIFSLPMHPALSFEDATIVANELCEII